MELNSLLFPAPKSSYRIGRIHGELIWIPKNLPGRGYFQRLHTAPEGQSSPITLNSSFSDDKIRKKFNKMNLTAQPESKVLHDNGISLLTVSLSNILLTEETIKSAEKADIFSFANQINSFEGNENSKKMDRFKPKNENFTVQSKEDKDYDSADEKVVGVEETPLARSLIHYSTTPKAFKTDKHVNTIRNVVSQTKKAKIVEINKKEDHNSEKSVKSKPRVLKHNPQYTLPQNGVSNKIIHVIKNNLSFEVVQFQKSSQKRMQYEPKNHEISSKNQQNETQKINMVAVNSIKAAKNDSYPTQQKAEEDGLNPKRSEIQKSDRDSFIDRLGQFSNPPTVRLCFKECYMYPKACLQMSSRVSAPPWQRFEMRIPLKNENGPKSNITEILSQEVTPSYRGSTPVYGDRPANKGLKSQDKYIPCMLLRPGFRSSKFMIYFHGNGEDINIAFDLLSHLRIHLRIHVLAVEYPGYGVYNGTPNEASILEDSERVYEYLVNHLNVDSREIVVFGRSIGSGPATHLAAKKHIGALVLMSAFTSIKSVTKDIAGTWAKILIKQRFDNLKAISKVSCPTFFVHGQSDTLIPYHHSKLLHDACKGPSELLLPKEMNHIELDFLEDFILPLKSFLDKCGFREKRPGVSRISFPRKLFETPDYLKPHRKSPPRSASPIKK